MILIAVFLLETAMAQVDPKPLTYFTQEEINLANTAEQVSYMNWQEKKAFLWMNLSRMYPKRFVAVVEFYAKQEYPEVKSHNKFVKSLINELNRFAPLHPIEPNELMYETAKCWAIEAGELGREGHNRKKCVYLYDAECCGYMDENSGFYHFLGLLVDEDVPDLAHRKIILSDDLHFAGISIQPHKQYGKNMVINFSKTDKNVEN